MIEEFWCIDTSDVVEASANRKRVQPKDTSTKRKRVQPIKTARLIYDDIPDSIDGIIRYMDDLEPNKDYFWNQQDSRGGCSKTRKKLRTFARKNPNHKAVAHWTKSGKWAPPDHIVLDMLITLLKEKIL